MLEAPQRLERDQAAGRGQVPVTQAAVHGLATAIPPGRLSSRELADRLHIEEEWILTRTGIRERPIAGPDERLSDYAIAAGGKALAEAGIEASELDLVLVATMTQDELAPSTAPVVAHALGAARAGSIDVGAACTSFLSALALGAAQIESGRARWILVIGADFVSRITNWEDRRTAPLFSDAVGATVLGPADKASGWIGPILLGCDGSGAAAIKISHADRLIRMDGHEVYRNAVARMSEATMTTLERAGASLESVDLFVPHQANSRITRAVAVRLGLPLERVVDCIARSGNCSAATLPVALAAARADGRLKPGSRVLLAAFGAGFTYGGGLIEWGTAGG